MGLPRQKQYESLKNNLPRNSCIGKQITDTSSSHTQKRCSREPSYEPEDQVDS